MLKKYPDILLVADIMEILKIGKSSAYKLLRSNQIKNKKIAGEYKISKNDMIKYIRGKEIT
ncbi:helix-turn-helix domain-containing protein [Fusobacterium gastrosuis]|uniref:helix-turn-helix domain-containing protein n=1 Tax=Fusobacterium gastrosuis TaxID=1755100 RepID=UPI002A9AAD5C|nr:helix-turn-helix domain-containing protein [Fusobacterium gastrosuis]